MKKSLFGLFCLSLMLHSPLTPVQAQEVQYPQSEQSSSQKEATMKGLKQTKAYRSLGKEAQKLIDEKAVDFGKLVNPYGNDVSHMILVNKSPFVVFANSKYKDRENCEIFFYPQTATADILINQPAPQTPAIYKKTGKPYFGISDVEMAALSADEQEYVKALLVPLNENFHAIYTAPVKKISPAEAREGALAGHLMVKPEIRPVAGTPFGDTLTPVQRELYDTLGGRFTYRFFETPEKTGYQHSVCGTTNGCDVGGREGWAITIGSTPTSGELKSINSGLAAGFQMGHIHILRQMKAGMRTVLADKEIDPKASEDLTPFKRALLKVAIQVDMATENVFKHRFFEHEEGKGPNGFHLAGKSNPPRPDKPMFAYVPEIYQPREVEAQLKTGVAPQKVERNSSTNRPIIGLPRPGVSGFGLQR